MENQTTKRKPIIIETKGLVTIGNTVRRRLLFQKTSNPVKDEYRLR